MAASYGNLDHKLMSSICKSMGLQNRYRCPIGLIAVRCTRNLYGVALLVSLLGCVSLWSSSIVLVQATSASAHSASSSHYDEPSYGQPALYATNKDNHISSISSTSSPPPPPPLPLPKSSQSAHVVGHSNTPPYVPVECPPAWTSSQDQQSLVPITNASDYNCTELNFCDDIVGFEAILILHRQLDEDANGDITIKETEEFIRDDLKYVNGANDRQKAFHGNDKHITVDELWRSWQVSAVHNWTKEQTVDWLCDIVELPQYRLQFELHEINGTALPRLATNSQFFAMLGINNSIHRQKIMLKATDVVLFGVPRPNTLLKDLFMCALLFFAIGGGWIGYIQSKSSQTQVRKMMKDMEALSNAEKQLEFLQLELNKTKQEHENAFKEKRDLEAKLKLKEQILGTTAVAAPVNAPEGLLQPALEEQRIAELQQELLITQDELRRIEKAYSTRQWIPPLRLQAYLQFTYEIEIKNYNAKKAAAERQLHAARDECDKLKRKRTSLFGAFRVAHGSSIDYVDNTILQARTLLAELTKEMQERIKRWKMIEHFCGFDIIHNPGYAQLEKALYGTSASNMAKAPSYIFPHNTSETTLIEEDSTDSASMASGFVPTPTSVVFPNSNVAMTVPRKISSLYTALPSSIPLAVSSSVEHSPTEEDNGLSMIVQNPEEFLIGNKTVYNRKITPTSIYPAEMRSKVSGTAIQPNRMVYFRRGSSDGVEKHFESLQSIPQLGSQSDSSIQSVSSMNSQQQQQQQQLLAYNFSLTGQPFDAGFVQEDVGMQSMHFYTQPTHHSSTETNEETSSSSESSCTIASIQQHQSLPPQQQPLLSTNGSNNDLNNSDGSASTAVNANTGGKKRNFFGIRKRKSSKTDKTELSKKDA